MQFDLFLHFHCTFLASYEGFEYLVELGLVGFDGIVKARIKLVNPPFTISDHALV